MNKREEISNKKFNDLHIPFTFLIFKAINFYFSASMQLLLFFLVITVVVLFTLTALIMLFKLKMQARRRAQQQAREIQLEVVALNLLYSNVQNAFRKNHIWTTQNCVICGYQFLLEGCKEYMKIITAHVWVIKKASDHISYIFDFKTLSRFEFVER